MKNVTLEGIDFVKASEVAKQFGYTSDYIGQLCRSKKINARLVGRTWFVNIPSLEAHREGRYQNIRVAKSEELAAEAVTEKIEKSDVAKKTYLKRVESPHARTRNLRVSDSEGSHDQVRSLSYEQDEFSLIPSIGSKPKVTLLKVGIADSEQLKVKSQSKKSSHLRPQPLPDVALSGKLSIQDITPDELLSKKSDSRDNHENKDLSKREQKIEPAGKVEKVSKSTDVKNESKTSTVTLSYKPRIKHLKPTIKNTGKPKQGDTVLITNNDSKKSHALSVVAISVALMFAAGILALEQVAYATPDLLKFSLHFSWSNLASVVTSLYTGT